MKEIPLSKGQVGFVDDADFEKVSAFKWCLSSHGYVVRRVPGSGKNGRIEYLHRFLMPGVNEVDHRNGDRRDNQRHNLRSSTHVQNTRGFRKKRTGTSSKFRGLSWDKAHGFWEASIRINKKKVSLGYFSEEMDAARAYDAAARKHYGEFASPNFL